jgi:hypothetical protein
MTRSQQSIIFFCLPREKGHFARKVTISSRTWPMHHHHNTSKLAPRSLRESDERTSGGKGT